MPTSPRITLAFRGAALSNNGFDPKVDFAVTNRPYGVAVGDFNGDGKLDIVATNSGSGTGQNMVSVLLRNAANTGFDAAVNYTTGVFSFTVAVGDFNHDGKQDIAASNQIPGSVAVLLRNAANDGFDGKVDFAGSSGQSVAVGDFNGDNRQDLVTENGSNVQVLQRVCNNAPSFNSVTNQTRLQGVSSNSQIAVVNDAETAPGSLTVTAPTVPSGITVANIVNTNGAVTADVGAAVNTPAGDYTVVLSVFDGEQTINANLIVTVTPIAQEVVVRGNNVIIADGDTTPSLADHTDFGQVALANTRERTFTIQNIGANPLTIQTVTVSGGQPAAFSVTQQPLSSIPGNGSTTFKIRFAPTALGLQSTTVNFSNNDTDENPFDFVIQATAIAAPTLGNYANTNIALSGNATVTPTAAPTNQTYTTATTTADFQGELEVDPATGVLRMTNAHPANRAGESYSITVTAYNAGGTTTKTFNLTVTTPPVCPFVDASTFAPVVNYPLAFGSNPAGTAVGDFNADGKQDIVVAGSNGISVLLRNAGNNGFDSPVVLSANFGPRSVAIADFNGDGKQDLVVGTSGFGTTVVAVYLRNAANTGFDPQINYSAGTNPVSVAVGDFNGDGRQDIVAANTNASVAVSVLLRNAANDGFDPPAGFGTGGSFFAAPAVGDFNGDGRQDIAVTNNSGSNVSVFLRNAANDGFAAAVDYTVGANPGSIAVGDFNADGKLDLIVANNGAGSNSVTLLLRNAGNNGFDPAVNINMGAGALAVAAGDFNHDGRQDIAVTTSNNVSVLLRNAANNGFDPKIDLAVGSGPNSVAVGDFNADGKQDMTTSNNSGNNISVLERGNCPPTIAQAIGLTRQQGSPAANSQIAVVEDFETPAGNLTVQATTVPTGITVSNIVNNNGTITANIAASCTAATGNNTVVLTATDAANASTNANLIVNVTANTPPTLAYPNASGVVNGSTTVNPSIAIDNVGIASFSLQSQGTYTGTISVNSANGAVSISSAAPVGAHTITIRAIDNCTAATDASFTLTVTQPPAITSAANTTFTVGTAGSFTITATGAPTSAISRTGALPNGVTLTDNGNGTASLAGTPAAGTGGSYPLTITAANGVLPNATQSFTLTVNQAPTFTSANSATFTIGSVGSFTVTTSAFPQVTTITRTGTLPSGVTFTNNGNGTATIAGTPTAGTSGNYALTFGAANGIPPNATQNFTLTVGTPEIAVEQPAGQGLLDGTSSVSFGAVNPGANNSLTFIVRNIGTGALTGLGITFDGANLGDFSVTSAPTASVAPGGSTMFTVRFAPTAAGMRAAALHIANNDADENTFDVGLTGSRYTNLEAWRVLHFGSPANSGDGANGNDFEFDGLSNLFEFATGSHPKQPSPRPGLLILNGSAMEFYYTRSAGAIADGLIFQVKFSDALSGASWSATGVTDDPIGGDETQRRAAVSQGSSGRRFLRLEVALPSP